MTEHRTPENKPKVLFAQLLEMKSATTGSNYFSGFIGNVRIVMFRDRDFEVDLSKPSILDRWNVFIEEAPARPKASKAAAERRP